MKRRNFLLTPFAIALAGKSEAVDKIAARTKHPELWKGLVGAWTIDQNAHRIKWPHTCKGWMMHVDKDGNGTVTGVK